MSQLLEQICLDDLNQLCSKLYASEEPLVNGFWVQEYEMSALLPPVRTNSEVYLKLQSPLRDQAGPLYGTLPEITLNVLVFLRFPSGFLLQVLP